MDSPRSSPASQEASEAPRLLTLHVVSPGIEGHRLTLPQTPATTTIAQLKLRIQEAAPSRPSPDQQRLIYQGKPLLVPDVTLATVFGPEALGAFDTFTIHMALRPTAPANDAPRNATAPTSTLPPGQHVLNDPSSAGHRSGFVRPTGHFGHAAVPPLPNPAAHGTQAAHHFIPPGQMPFPGAAAAVPPIHAAHGHPGFQHVYQQQQRQLQQQLDQMMPSHPRTMSQHGESPARGSNSDATRDQQGSEAQDESQGTATSANPSSQGNAGQTNGAAPIGFAQQGQIPGASWRISVEQTTIHHPNLRGPHMPAAFGPPAAAPNTAPSSNHPPNAAHPAPLPPGFASGFPPGFPQAFIPQYRPPFAPRLPISLPARDAAWANPAAFPQQLFLLTGPSGYQALLVPPEGPISMSPHFNLTNDTPTQTTQPQPLPRIDLDDLVPVAGANGDDPAAVGEANQQPGDQILDIVRIRFPLGHLWLLVRLLGFVYLFTGGATWTRTIVMSSIALLVFVAQAGWLAPFAGAIGDPIRRRVEGIVHANGQRQPQPQQQQPPQNRRDDRAEPAERADPQAPQAGDPPRRDGAGAGASGAEPAAGASGLRRRNADSPESRTAAAGPGVTPEQLAARLMRERGERDQSVVRDAMRRLERSVALFVTSLVPGWGEEHVRAQTEADALRARQQAEAEIERRRREEADAPPAEPAAAGPADVDRGAAHVPPAGAE